MGACRWEMWNLGILFLENYAIWKECMLWEKKLIARLIAILRDNWEYNEVCVRLSGTGWQFGYSVIKIKLKYDPILISFYFISFIYRSSHHVIPLIRLISFHLSHLISFISFHLISSHSFIMSFISFMSFHSSFVLSTFAIHQPGSIHPSICTQILLFLWVPSDTATFSKKSACFWSALCENQPGSIHQSICTQILLFLWVPSDERDL